MNTRVLILLLGCAGIAVLVWFLADMFPGSLDSDVDQANLVRAFALMILIGAGLVLSPRLNIKGAFKAGFIWVMIGLALVAGYTLKDDFAAMGSRVLGALIPSMAVENGAGEITLNRRNDGHFHVNADVNGARVQFLVDTGASVVTLTRDDAERAGLDPSTLSYSQRFQTANGAAYGAPVRVDRLSIGNITVTDVRAAVMEKGLDTSLLGMSFLDRLASFSIKGDTLTLRR